MWQTKNVGLVPAVYRTEVDFYLSEHKLRRLSVNRGSLNEESALLHWNYFCLERVITPPPTELRNCCLLFCLFLELLLPL